MALEKKAEERVDRTALTQVEAALQTLVEAEAVDETALESISGLLEGLNDKTRAAIMDLSVMQEIVQQRAETVQEVKPGEYVKQGMFEIKKPYSLKDLYTVWGIQDSYVPARDYTIVTPGGWVFYLREGVIYDQPRETPAEEVPENHGYQLPKIVISIINDMITAQREIRKTTESDKPFGYGMKFLGTGWAGKDFIVSEAASEPHPDPTV